VGRVGLIYANLRKFVNERPKHGKKLNVGSDLGLDVKDLRLDLKDSTLDLRLSPKDVRDLHSSDTH